MTWFGSLDLAWKYALVFGAALALTLFAGFVKVLLDKRKLNKHVKQMDLEKGDSTRNSEDDQILHMREKDEGDLFGIRAIEAGFFGGVAQSNPNSPSVSRAGSRNGSPAPSNRIPYNGYNPSPASPQSLIQPHYNNHGDSMISSSSSILDLAQYRDSVGQSSSIPSVRFSKSSTALIDHPAQVDSVFSVLSPAPAAYTPIPTHTQAPLNKLRPSHAEINGRINHTSTDVSNDGQSPDASGQRHSLDCPFHGNPQNLSSGANLSVQAPDRASHLSTMSSIYPSPEEWEESTQKETARLVNGPDKKGKKTIEVGSLDNPSIDETSQRGSIVSRATSASSKYQSPKKDARAPPVPPLRLPLFQKKAIIGASNPEFDRFRKARMQISEEDEEAASQVNNKTDRKIDPALLSAASPRTSFSFDYANSDGTHPEERAFSAQPAQPAPRYISRRLYAHGTYNPVGAPSATSTHSGTTEDPF